MSFLIRDRLHSGRTRFVAVGQHEDPQLAAVHNALADIDAQLRREMPKLFKKVDKIRSRPGRQIQRTEQPFATTRRVLECPRCGESFPALKRNDIYCSTACSGEQRRFLNERRRDAEH